MTKKNCELLLFIGMLICSMLIMLAVGVGFMNFGICWRTILGVVVGTAIEAVIWLLIGSLYSQVTEE